MEHSAQGARRRICRQITLRCPSRCSHSLGSGNACAAPTACGWANGTSRTHDAAPALDEAARKIERSPKSGLAAPRRCPTLARSGRGGFKSERYWVVFSITQPLAIVGVFYDAADSPNRLSCIDR